MVYTDAIFLGLYCSIETSRTLRVSTRTCIVRIAAAVSQERVLVCITRKAIQPENAMV